MSLSRGVHLGVYEIIALVGVGGMGEVYRARDTRLDRIVAIKILAASLAADPQLRDRFDREARAISSLNHPHICTLFDVGHQDGVDFLVLEYLEGQTLAERLARGGAIDLNEALKIAIGICDALDKAHRSGIVHRDLKPANVMLTKSGAKLLDFGLAKSAAPAVATTGLSMLPTTPPNLTAQGTILGTFQYMAPEQIEGLEADARTDLFAFGAVLYEMLAGRKAFEGKSQASLIGAILKDTSPPLATLQPLTPPMLDHIIQRCLAKDPDGRWQTAADLRMELQWVTEAAPAPLSAPLASRSPRLWQWTSAALLVALLAVVAIIVRGTRETSGAANPVVFEVEPPEGATFITPLAASGHPQFALSGDGQNLAFAAVSADGRQQLWIRPLALTTARMLAGTDGADAPFWSADGRTLGFFAQGKLKTIDRDGGPPQTVAEAPGIANGGTWNRENVIVFASMFENEGLKAVRPGGSDAAVPVTRVDPKKEKKHAWPEFLPGGRHFLYAAVNSSSTASDIFIGSLDGGEPRFLMTADAAARYAEPDYLLFPRDGTLMAQRFDAEDLRLLGEPVRLLDTIGNGFATGYTALSVSAAGQLAYGQTAANEARVVWRDRTGRLLGPPGSADATALSLSRDGSMLALSRRLPQTGTNIWLSDVRRPAPIILTLEGASNPIWSPDRRFVAFSSRLGGELDQLYRKALDSSPVELLGPTASIPTDWSEHGNLIIFHRSLATSWDVEAMSVSERKSSSVLNTPSHEVQGTLSSDGHWLAYASDEGGRFEVFVRPFPATGEKRLVSSDGGTEPRWRSDGRELFYLSPDRRLMGVPVPKQTAPRFEYGRPEVLFDVAVRDLTLPFGRRYDVSADGQQFVMLEPPQRRPPPITVLINWTGALRGRPN